MALPMTNTCSYYIGKCTQHAVAVVEAQVVNIIVIITVVNCDVIVMRSVVTAVHYN